MFNFFQNLSHARTITNRGNYSKNIIREQVYDLAHRFVKGNIQFDEENADWLVIDRFRLPDSWRQATTNLMIVFPQNYPTTPPIGFYLPATLRSPNGHFFNRAYHGADAGPLMEGWNWYCCTVKTGAWQPYPARNPREWLYGDNLWTYITLINEVLGSPINSD